MAGICEYDDCDVPARFSFGVGRGSFAPTRGRIELCQDHAGYLYRLIDDEDGPGQMTFFERCGLVPAAPAGMGDEIRAASAGTGEG